MCKHRKNKYKFINFKQMYQYHFLYIYQHLFWYFGDFPPPPCIDPGVGGG